MYVQTSGREMVRHNTMYDDYDARADQHLSAARQKARRRARTSFIAASTLLLPLLGTTTGLGLGTPVAPQLSLAVAGGNMSELPLPHMFFALKPYSYDATTQTQADWCVPASAETSLQTVLGRRIDQGTLAAEMHIGAYGVPGTTADSAVSVLNRYVEPHYEYAEQIDVTPRDLADDIFYDLVDLGVAPMASEAPHRISYTGDTNAQGHEIDVVAIDTTSQDSSEWSVEILDPEPTKLGGGYRWMSLDQLDQNITPIGQTGAAMLGVIRQ